MSEAQASQQFAIAMQTRIAANDMMNAKHWWAPLPQGVYGPNRPNARDIAKFMPARHHVAMFPPHDYYSVWYRGDRYRPPNAQKSFILDVNIVVPVGVMHPTEEQIGERMRLMLRMEQVQKAQKASAPIPSTNVFDNVPSAAGRDAAPTRVVVDTPKQKAMSKRSISLMETRPK